MLRFTRSRRRKKRYPIVWEDAPDIKKKVDGLINSISDISWAKKGDISCMRSQNANTRAYARIWGLSRIWQMALSTRPTYIIEVISEKFDKLPEREKDKVLLHEIAHIPKNFSGSLLPHTRGKKGSFHDKLKRMIKSYDRLK